MEFRVLGPLEVERDGVALPLGGARQRAVLGVLLLRAGEVVSTDRLIDDLWGDKPPATAAHALQVYVSNLRKVLGGRDADRQYLVTRAPGYVIELEPGELDLDRFERMTAEARAALAGGEVKHAAEVLRDALGLWRGSALADFAFEAFAQNPAGRLEELRLAALEDRLEADLALGRDAELVGELEVFVRDHPLRERPRGQLMLALYRAGRQSEALEVYQDTRRRLVEQLGIDPSPALQQLERAILNHDPDLALRRDEAPSTARAVAAQATRSILLVPRAPTSLGQLVAYAEPLARSSSPHQLIVSRLVDLAEAASLTAVAAEMNELRADLSSRSVPARVAAFTTANAAEDAVRLASEQSVDLLLLDTHIELRDRGEFPADLRTILSGAPCDVALVVARAGTVVDGPIVVPFSGAEHDWSALELGAWLASATQAPLRLIGTAGDLGAGRRDASRLLASASLAVQQLADVAPEPLLAERGSSAVIEASATAALVVLGLSPRWHGEGLGTARLAVVNEARPPVILVRRGLRPGGLAPAENLTHYTWSLAGPASDRTHG